MDFEQKSRKLKKNYKDEKILMIILIFLTLLSISLLSFLVHIGLSAAARNNILEEKSFIENLTNKKPRNERSIDLQIKKKDDKINLDVLNDVCLTKSCTLTAAMLISSMDTSVDPCEDFYKFSCGNFIRKNPVPDGETYFTSEMLFNRHFELQMKDLLESLNAYDEPNVVQRVQELYHVCINTTYQPEKELEALQNFTRNILHWPLIDGKNWTTKFENMTDFIIFTQHFQTDYKLLSIEINNYMYNSTNKTFIALKPSELMQNVEGNFYIQFDDNTQLTDPDATRKMFHDIVRLLGNTDDEQSINDDLNDMLNISSALAYQELWSKMKNATQDMKHTNTTVKGLTEMTNHKIDWLKILNAEAKGNYVFNEDDEISVVLPPVFEKFSRLVDEYPIRTFANLHGWLKLTSLLRYGGPYVEKIYRIYEVIAEEHEIEHEHFIPIWRGKRWKHCLSLALEKYHLVLTRIFANKHINKLDIQGADEFIYWIQTAFKNYISRSTVLDEETKNKGIDQINTLKKHVGYPDFIFNDEDLEDYYSYHPTVKSTHFDNVAAFKYNQLKSRPENMTIRNDWEDMPPLTINAMYIATDNSMWYPARILQAPYLDVERPAAINFGSMASVIGHEIGHSLQFIGIKRNETEPYGYSSFDIFEERKECFIEQYNNYCPEELQGGENDTKTCVNGEMTFKDNLADVSGLQTSFDAYRTWVEKHGKEKLLPGLTEYSMEQLFFISFAYSWCENLPIDQWANTYKYGWHAPPMQRVIGSVANSVEFRNSFHCPVGPMNRGNKTCIAL